MSRPTGRYQMGVLTDPDNWREWTGATVEHVARILCERCNSRFGELEAKIAPIVRDLVTGRAVSIDPDSQALLAQWTYKTGLMVATSVGVVASQLPRQYYWELGGTYDLPPGSAVWIGEVVGPETDLCFWVQRFLWWDRLVEEVQTKEGFAFVLGVASLGFVVAVQDLRQSVASVGVSPFTLGALGHGKLLRLWPASRDYGLRWPPSERLAAPDLKAIAVSFSKFDTQTPASTETSP